MPSPRFPIPQGTLDMLILQILSLEPAHGYGIAQRLEQISRSVVQVNQGSLYPALHRLQQKGWLRAEWKQSETGREAKFYSLTAAGRRQLAVEVAFQGPAAEPVQEADHRLPSSKIRSTAPERRAQLSFSTASWRRPACVRE